MKRRCWLVLGYCIGLLVISAETIFIPPAVSPVDAYTFNYYQVTSSGANNSDVDVAVDTAGRPHAIYLRANYLYYRKCLCPEEAIAYAPSGWSCAIAIGPNNVPQVAFRKNAVAWYTSRTGGTWQDPVQVSPPGLLISSTVDIDVDAANVAHIIFDTDSDTDGATETMYCNNTGGTFGSPAVVIDSPGPYNSYYSKPSIKMDSLGFYHIACVMDRPPNGGSFAAVFSNGPCGYLYSSSYNNGSVNMRSNCLAADPFKPPGTMRVVYEIAGIGSICVGVTLPPTTLAPALWIDSWSAPGAAPTIDSRDTAVGIAYENTAYTTIEMTEDTGTGYGTAQSIHNGVKPVIAYGSINIYYILSSGHVNEVYLGSDPAAVSLPALTTDDATGIGTGRATLNGTLTDEGGQACQYHFASGTTQGGPYTDNTSWAGSKISGQVFSDNITGLTKGTIYYYVAECKNDAGATTGAEKSFTTPTEPAVTTDNATSVMARTAILHGNLTSTGGADTTVAIFSGTSEGSWARSDNFSISAAGPFSLGVMGLTPSTTYFYRCYAENVAGGNWAPSSASFTTQADLGLWKNYWQGPGKDWFWFSSGPPTTSPPPTEPVTWRNYWEGPGKDWWRFSSGPPTTSPLPTQPGTWKDYWEGPGKDWWRFFSGRP